MSKNSRKTNGVRPPKKVSKKKVQNKEKKTPKVDKPCLPRAMSKYYWFTLNNYTEEEEYEISNTVGYNPLFGYICFGKERGEKNGVPHLQGYIELTEEGIN